MTSTVTPTESSPARRWGRRTRAAASSMRATIRDVANTGGKASAGSRLRALARSDCATVRCAEAVELTASSLPTLLSLGISQFGSDVDRPMDGSVDWTAVLVD